MRIRYSRPKRPNFAIFVNQESGRFNQNAIGKLTTAITKAGGQFTLFEPRSATELLQQANVAVGIISGAPGRGGADRSGRTKRQQFSALVSCGGDGTFNLVARAAIQAGLPVGLIPMGTLNNIARSLLPSLEITDAIEITLAGRYTKIDMARASDLPFFGSIALGFVPALAGELQNRKPPRYGIGWSQIGGRAAAKVKPRKTVLKVDSFRFDITPTILNINLVPFSCGLPLTSVSSPDDGYAEILFDDGIKASDFSSFTRQVFKRNYLYGSRVKLFRGRVINIQMVKGRTLYLDGELLTLPNSVLDISFGAEQLKLFR